MRKISNDKIKYYPLTHAQKRIYYDEKMFPGTSVSIQAFIVRYRQILDRDLLEKAINKVIMKNDGFRLRMIEFEFESEPSQYVSQYKYISIDYFDFTGPNSESRLRDWVKKTTHKPLQILDSDLFYFALIKYNKNESGYYMKFHHAASDGGSYPLVFAQVNEIYEELKTGKSMDDTPKPSYIRYITDEKEYLQSQQVKKDKEFWHGNLLPLPEPLNLSPKKGDPGNKKGKMLVTTFPDHVRNLMEEYGKKHRASLFKLFFTAISIYAHRITGLDDFVIGAVNHNRAAGNRKEVIGMFVSTIPIRVKVNWVMTFNDFIEKIGRDINYILKNHQNYPFDRLAGEIRETTGADIEYLLDIFISSHGDVDKDVYTFEHIFQGYVPNSLNVHINYNNKYLDGILEVEYEYRLDHYSEMDVARIHQGVVNILNNALTNPNKKISGIELISPWEKEKILYVFNKTGTDYPRKKNVIELFETAVEKWSEKIALVYEGEALTYNDLDVKANQLGNYLYSEKKIRMEEPVGILMERSHHFIIAIIAILKAGGVYVSIVPSLPMDRIKHMINDTGIAVIISQNKQLEILNRLQKECDVFQAYLCVDSQDISQEKYRTEKVGRDIRPENQAYVIYTSGTTGIPKGVVVGHRSLVNLCYWHNRYYQVTESDNATQYAAFSFDASVWEVFPYLVIGATLHIISYKIKLDVEKLGRYFDENNITISFLPTQFCELFMKRYNRYLKKLLTGGDKLRIFIRRGFKLYNNYGPTENTVVTTSYPVVSHMKNIPIGKPIDNNKIYILDKNGRHLIPIGVPGELCIGGESLAFGYLNRPELTAEKFVENPFDHRERIYKTGDLVQWLSDGNIEYLGRIDQQVKIRGFRIEIGEIESKILKHQEQKIKDAIVIVREDDFGEKYLCGYILADKNIDITKLQTRLSKELPDFMIPAYFVQIDDIPLTPSGKVNRKALPVPEIKEEEYIAPRDEIDENLAKIWSQLLNMKKDTIGIDDNFFKLGGHSLKVAVMITKIHKDLNIKVLMNEVFEMPTIRKLGEHIKGAKKEKFTAIELTEKKEYYPQTSPQKRMYFMDRMAKNSTLYNIQMMDVYCKGINKEILEQAFKKLIKRHESLRTSFFTAEGEAVFKVHDYDDVISNFEVEYWETAADGMIYSEEPGKEWTKVTGIPFHDVIEHFVKSFDLDKPPLIRVGFIKIWENMKILMLDMHHIMSDGVSLMVLLNDLWPLYDGDELSGLRIQYKDYAEWVQREEQKKMVKKQENYWLKEFEAGVSPLDLPTNFPRPAHMTFDGDMLHFEINEQETRKLRIMAQKKGQTIYMTLLTAYYVLLSKLSGQEDITVGTFTAGRGHADLLPLVGMFVGTLALRNYPTGNKTFEEFMDEIKKRTITAFDNQDYPFQELVSKIAPTHDKNRNPLFDITFALENEAERNEEYLLEALMLGRTNPYLIRRSKFDMMLTGAETGEDLQFNFEFNTALFKEETIERFIRYFKQIIDSICSSIDQEIACIDILTKEERNDVLYEFNKTKSEYPHDKTIQQLFTEQVAKTPGNTAVVFYDPDTNSRKTINYSNLNKRANQLAHLLQAHGVTSESIVGITAQKSIEMIIGIIAVLKAGGAYLPLNTDYPDKRKQYLMADSNSRILLTNFKTPIDYVPVVIDLDDENIYQDKTKEQFSRNYSKDGLAYIMYTSGSTGKPKGVMVEQVNVVRLVKNTNFLQFNEDECILQTGALEFDASTVEIWGCLLNGLTLYLATRETILNAQKLKKTLLENQITTIWMTSALFNQMLDAGIDIFSGLKYLLTGGDVVSPTHVARLRAHVPGIQVINGYGPTENTTFSATNPIKKDYKDNIPIGKPIANSTAYILDKLLNPVPIGVGGELFVGGDGVARGYLNRPHLTHSKFIPDPFISISISNLISKPKTMYATGDLSRWLPDGTIEFLGRLDFQVKIRGFRIEPGEIDNYLMRIDFIEDACVIARKDPGGLHYLCAYFVSPHQVKITELKELLQKDLPAYMIPSYFTQMDVLPLTANGKVDRRALPEPQVGVRGNAQAPKTENEKLLVEILQKVLGIKQISIDDNFFEIGGDSIKTILVSARLQKRQLGLNVNDFFTFKTIRRLAKHVREIERKIPQGPVEGWVELTPIQRWFFHRDLKEKHHFNHVVIQHRSQGFDDEILKKVFTKIVEHHDALRIIFDIDEKTGTVIQRNRALDEGKMFDLEVIDFGNKDDFREEMDSEVNRINRGINLKTGPLLKLGLFKTNKGDYLMIGIHHAVVDGISWRILMEDFEAGYEQAEKGEDIKLQDKTDSYKYWAHQLKRYANSSNALTDLDYWRKIEETGTGIKRLPKDHEISGEMKTLKNREIVSMVLNEEETGKLLREVNWVYNTEINDILLTALASAVNQWSGNEKVLLGLEGHGREGIIKDIDISRTVGWFTSMYPVIIDIKPKAEEVETQWEDEEVTRQIKHVKETLRRILNKGVGYGILKYLTSPEKKKNLTFKLQPEISFNYHGELDLGKNTDGSGKNLQSRLENNMSAEFDTGYSIDIYGSVEKKRLNLYFSYNKYEYERTSIEKFVDFYKFGLLKIINHCTKKKKEILSQGMNALEYHIHKDYEKYLEQVKEEQWPDLTVTSDYEHILLTGSTGFMGAHLVVELLENTNAKLYLPVRDETQEKAEERYQRKMDFYFGADFYHTYKDRLIVLRADLGETQLGMESETYQNLCKTIGAVLHPAANVKHHVPYEELYRDNVMGTEHLLEFSISNKKMDFYYISTLDVGRGNIPGKDHIVFTEYCHDVGQRTEHVYVKSKFEAEKRVMAYRQKGINASIYRVGNLIFHTETGKFQENIEDDYFYSTIKGVVKLGMLTEKMEKMIFDMSFINYIAKATVLLFSRKGLKNETFHLCNPNILPMTEMTGYLREEGYELKYLKEEEVEDYLAQFEGNSEYERIIELLKIHSWVFEQKEGTIPYYKIDRTVMLLDKLGFQWPKANKKLIDKMIAYCKEVGFL